MTKHKRFSGIVSALLAMSTWAATVPAQAQEERGRWSRGEGTRQVERGASRGQMPSRGPERQRATVRPDGIGQQPDRPAPQVRAESPDRDSRRGGWNRDRDGDRSTWNRDGNDERGTWQRDRNRQGWSGDRDGNRDRDRNWSDNRRWDRDGRDWNNRRDWHRDRSDSRNRWTEQRRWDHDWRRDNRYDWQRYRTYNRGIYRMPRYYAPYGWNQGYRSFSIGVVLNSGLYGRDYWISDPGHYRLPPAHGHLRWVRYYDDALLVDVRDGYVVDVIRNFFW